MTVPSAPRPGRIEPERLFRPAAVLVVGAATGLGARVLANLRTGGFAGRIATAGDPAEIEAQAGGVDAALICAEGSAAAAAFPALAACGIRSAIVFGMVPGLGELARAHGVRALGPGSFGVAAPGVRLNATVAHLAPQPGRLALVSQSAALCRAVLDWATPNGVGFSHIIGIGGNEDVGFAPTLDWLSRDPGTGAILLDIRRVRDARRFLSAARAAAQLRPVVALRPGARLRDPTGEAEATLAAALNRVGVLCVADLDGLLAAAETLTRARPARGEALAIVTNAIGPAWLAADAAVRAGLTLATLEEPTRQVLRLVLPEPLRAAAGEAGIVYVGADGGTRLADAAALLAGAAEVGGVLAVHAPAGADDATTVAALVAAAQALRVPVLTAAMGETTGAAHRQALVAAGLPAFATPEAAVRGFLYLVQHRRVRAAARELPPASVLALLPDREAVAAAFAAARAEARPVLAQEEALAVLAAYGIASVPTRRADTPEQATAAAEALGLPVVLKRRRTAQPARGARRVVVLDLREPAHVADAARLLLRGAPAGLVVQPQIGRLRELRVGTASDPLFGPTISFGEAGAAAGAAGGAAAGAIDLPPLNRPLAQALIGRAHVGLAEAEAALLADVLVAVSQLLVDFPELAALEIDPLFLGADGVRVVDAWIALHPEGEAAAPLAIAPYPAELETRHAGRGETFILRPIRPEDAAAHAAFFSRLPPEDVRFRFFSALRELSPERIVRLTQVDYQREIAFIAVRPATGETVGVARLILEQDDDSVAEFAIAIQPDAKGQGLGRALMRLLFAWARAKGVTEITGQILSDNAPMLGFARSLGFSLHHMPEAADVVEARLTLAGGSG